MEFHNMNSAVCNAMYNQSESLIRAVCADLGHDDRAGELVKKHMDKTFIKIKPMKDPTKPKRSMSSYMLFCNANRGRITADDPSLKLGDISKRLANEWAKQTKEDRKPYIRAADDLRDEYDQKIIDWRTQKPNFT